MNKKIAAMLLAVVLTTSSLSMTALATATGSTSSSTKKSSSSSTKKAKVTTYKAGTYTVGKNLPAGEYYLAATDTGAFFQRNKGGEIVTNQMFSKNTFMQVKEGETVKLSDCKAVAIKHTPKPKTDKNGYYGVGVYRVGIDIPAGKYTIVGTSKGFSPAIFSTYEDIDMNAFTGQRIAGTGTINTVGGTKTIELFEGEYFELSSGKFKAA